MNKAIFIDKDGTLIHDIPYNVNPDLITLQDGALEALKFLQLQGYLIVIVSNQPGVAHGFFEESSLKAVENKISGLLERKGINLAGFYYCPHYPNAIVSRFSKTCQCRKPMPGLIIKAAHELNIDRSRSWMIGDILHDVEAGKRAGCRTILLNNGNETEWKINEYRTPDKMVTNLVDAARFIQDKAVREVLI